METKSLLFLNWMIFFNSVSATVFITHGLGTYGISYYQNSAYIDLIKESAKDLGHEVICIPWLDAAHPDKGFAGILPQERIKSAVEVAKAVLDKIKSGEKIILIGHGYGGQVMACASRLLNPENSKLTDSFIYELIYAIKNYDEQDDEPTRAISAGAFLQAVILGWRISKSVFDVIASSNLVNQGLIKFIKQNLSLKFTEETKVAWNQAFRDVQNYIKKNFKTGFDCEKSIYMIYSIGTVFSGDMAFLPDMKVVNFHVNFYSKSDSIVRYVGKSLSPANSHSTNLGVFFEPTKSQAPKHADFCGNILMGRWLLQVPELLKDKKFGGFESFKWGINGSVTFYSGDIPMFTPVL